MLGPYGAAGLVHARPVVQVWNPSAERMTLRAIANLVPQIAD